MPKAQIFMLFRWHCHANSTGVSTLRHNPCRIRNPSNSKNLAPKSHLNMGQKGHSIRFFNSRVSSCPSFPGLDFPPVEWLILQSWFKDNIARFKDNIAHFKDNTVRFKDNRALGSAGTCTRW